MASSNPASRRRTPSAAPARSGRDALLPPNPGERAARAITNRSLPAVRPPAEAVVTELSEDHDDDARITQVSAPPEPFSLRERIVLLRMDGIDAGRLYPLGADTYTIGRHQDNALRLEDGGISRFHARVTWLGNAHAIEDLASSNGTWLRGRRISRAVLANGDIVQLGSHASFRYTATDRLHEKLLRQLHESSTRDALTGAYNRRHFDERLRAELAYAARHGLELGMVLFDLDHFKRINDSRGHAAGDAVLRHVARVAAAQLRGEDVFARYGGEEFVVLLRATDARDTVRVAERIRASVGALPASFDGRPITVTLSGGCATLSELSTRTPAGAAAELSALADQRLYAAKDGGRDRIVGGSPSGSLS